LISHRIRLEDVNVGLLSLRGGAAARTVIVFGPEA
jgi:hypothetical protein